MRPQPALIPGICLALASPVLADERGDELIAAYLDQAAGKNARVTIQIKHVKGSQPPIFLAFTWMRRVQAKLTSHFIRMEAPPSEQGKLLLVHERPDGSSDYVAYRPQSALQQEGSYIRRPPLQVQEPSNLGPGVDWRGVGQIHPPLPGKPGNRRGLLPPGGEPAQARIHRQERFSPLHPGIERRPDDHGPVGAV